MTARQKLIDTAKSLRGQRNKVTDLYNSMAKPLPLGYRVKYEDLQCAVFASVPFLILGWSDIVPPHCRARELYNNMKALGCSFWGSSRTPDPGDLIFFGVGGSVSKIDHAAIVEKVENGIITFWDIRSVVASHTCAVGGKYIKSYGYIMGYGMPDYASKDTDEPEPAPAPAIGAGDLVKIREGARWYSGSSIKASVLTKNWYVIQNKSGRVVLGMDESERSNIQSPIHEEDVILVRKNGETPAEPAVTDQQVTVSVTVREETWQWMQTTADAKHWSVGQLIDKLAEDAR